MDEQGDAPLAASAGEAPEAQAADIAGDVAASAAEPFPTELYPLFRSSLFLHRGFALRHRNIALYDGHLVAAITPTGYRIPVAAGEPGGVQEFIDSLSYANEVIDARMDEIASCVATLDEESDRGASYPTVKFTLELYGDETRAFHVLLAESPHIIQSLAWQLGERFSVEAELAERFETREMKYLARRQEGQEHARSHAGSEPAFSRLGGFAMVLAGVGIIAAMFWLIWSWFTGAGGWYWRLPLALVCYFVARGVIEHGHGMAAPRFAHVMAKATQPPILYLRSFKSEDSDIPPRAATLMAQSVQRTLDKYLIGYVLSLFYGLVRLGRMITASGSQRVEERIAPILRRFGPLVAIGKPGEPSTSLGAARAYVSDDEWQDFIRQTMAQAQLVVIQVESTDGTWWELEQTLREMPIERVLMLFTARYGSRQNYEEVWLKVHRGLGFQLPRYIGDAAIVYFDPDGTPHTLKLQYHSPLISSLTPSPIAWRRSLKPFMQHFADYAGIARGKVS